jgi:formylglycine-generating enzyme required for sulfatase activity
MAEGKIFISYRRADASGYAGRLFDRLSEHFGEENIFMDVEGLSLGVDFHEALDKAVGACDVLIALIGKQWLDIKDENRKRRLDDPEDFVRIEIAAALNRDIRIIPILVQDARMPEAKDLPDVLHRLARYNGMEIRHERFNADADRLIRGIENCFNGEKERLNTLKRGMMYVGILTGLILIFVLAIWGGNRLLSYLRGSETPRPISTTQIVAFSTDTDPASMVTATLLRTKTQTSSPTETSAPDTPQPPTPTPWSQLITDDYGVPMALVPSGFFEMGGNPDQFLAECEKLYTENNCQRDLFTDEAPIHTVWLDNYYIDIYEVTNALYAKCVEDGVCQEPQDGSSTRETYYSDATYADYPVIYVSWFDANTYCQWRGVRLPTEAEWEKAARGGQTSQLYSWGDTFESGLANFCDINCQESWKNINFDDSYEDTAPVGSYIPNGYGLFDMAGNVREWVADWYNNDFYSNSSQNNPQGPMDGNDRVIRNGSWRNSGFVLRTANRIGRDPSKLDSHLGFRCVRSP